jgi:NACalpha-BTF3-like transcription factor
VDVISKYVRLIAVCKRLSPNDFASDGIAPASGFAKLIDSLPKIEARKERIARLKAIEEHSAWPVNCAILVWAGVLPESAKTMKLRVQFSEIEMPKSESERSQANTTDVQLGITSPIQLIMERYGLSEEAATEAYEKNKGFIPQPAQAPQEPVASSLGAIIAARRTAR